MFQRLWDEGCRILVRYNTSQFDEHYFVENANEDSGSSGCVGFAFDGALLGPYLRRIECGPRITTEDRRGHSRGFAQGDVDRIMVYHHPEVIKALSFHKYLVGRDAVAEDLRKTLQQFKLAFEENRVESLLIQGDTAIEQTVFAIRVTPMSGGESSLFRGRTQVVYVRYKTSPTGWASIREIIQPATD